MPVDDGGMNHGNFSRESPKLQGRKESSPGHFPSSSMGLAAQSTPPATFCTQQSPHRVQSSTNLDLVDCVGSDLVLAMNNLDLGEQTRSSVTAMAATANGSLFHGGSGGADSYANSADRPPSPLSEGFLPLAALAPPPARQPAWLTAQQQHARSQNEHFPARIYGSSRDGTSNQMGGDHSRGADSVSGSIHGVRGCAGEETLNPGEYFEYPQTNGTNGSGGSSRISPGAVPPPGFGIGGGMGATPMDHGLPSRGISGNGGGSGDGRGGGASLGGRRSRSGGSPGTTPHLDESWTAVLNAPAGAEMMEFLTEQASRALVLWNVEAIGEDELRLACEAHGPLYYLRAEHRRKRVVFLAYYDVRDAVNAHRSLGAELSRHLMSDHGSRPPPAVHFSVELHAGFSYKEGSLLVHNIPSQATEAEVASVFQIYGDLRRVTRLSTPHQAHPATFSVEFCSIQASILRRPVAPKDSRVAAQELAVRNPWGHAITVEPAIRSERERALGRQLHATLNRWAAEATQPPAAFPDKHHHHQHQYYHHKHHPGMLTSDDRMRSTSSSLVLSGRSSDSDSPPPKPEDYPRDFGRIMDSYTPMTSANTTPSTTPGSTPPSGSDAHSCLAMNAEGQSLAVQYVNMPLQHSHQHQQKYSRSAGLSPSSSRDVHMQHQHHRVNSSGSGSSSSAGPHHMFPSASAGAGGHPPPRLHLQHMHSGGDIHPPPPYGSPSPGAAGVGAYYDLPLGYHGERDDDRAPAAPVWAAAAVAAGLSLSPPSARGGPGGVRGSPPLRGMPGSMMACHGGAGSFKDRSRQASLDEGRLSGGSGGGGGGRSMRCNSDGGQMLVSAAPGCGGSGGDEFSLDLKKVSKGLDKRTTIMIRNIPNKYTQAMLLQEIDASYRGSYDFFYLPIDFKNKCNVGYAFINFMDYRRIVPFFREFNGQRWKNFNSEKVCAISYARIQGKASMISRFQNSSLMEKDGEYRPLIFHSSGSERGRPEPFPASSKVFRGGAAPVGSGGGGGSLFRERTMSGSSTVA